MMFRLLYKEWALAAPAVTVMFVLLGALVLVPAYPYGMVFFFGMLGTFFCFQFARENADLFYTALLPLAKGDIVKAKCLLVVSIEVVQLVFTMPFAILRLWLLPGGNPVGIEANVAYFGMGLIVYAVFNAVYLCVFFRSGVAVGKAFIFAILPALFLIVLMEGAVHLPEFAWVDSVYVSDQLRQLPILIAGVLIYVLGMVFTYRAARRSFEHVDL